MKNWHPTLRIFDTCTCSSKAIRRRAPRSELGLMLPQQVNLVYEQHQEMPCSPRESLPEDEILPIIQTLPADVLREIFRRCLPPFKYQESTNFELDQPPYTLAKVCRHWRSVCLSTPLLWVDFPIFTGQTSITPEFSGHWRTKLALSSPCDLRLYINHYAGMPEDAITKRLGPIQPAFSRARTLDLCANMPMLRVISKHVDLFKRLQILKINLTEGPPNSPNLIPQLDFHSKVTSLTLQSRRRVEVSRCLLKAVETLLPNLTKFDGEYLPASSFREILSIAPFLEQLTIRNVQTANPYASVSSPLIHTHLKMLHLICKQKAVRNPGEPLPIDLSGIRLSELEDLVVQYPLSTVSSAFLSFLEHTQGSLRNLLIGGVFQSSYDQMAMYDLCPRLETLTIGHATDESLKHLTRTGCSGNKLMCPKLRHLILPLFRPNAALQYDIQTLWLSELTSCRFWGPNDPDVPIDYVPLESITVVVHQISDFLHFQSLQDLGSTLLYYLPVALAVDDMEFPMSLLVRLKKYVERSFDSICFLDDLGILACLKEFAERETESADTQPRGRSLQEEAKVLYADFTNLLDEVRAKPHWKLEKDSILKKRLEKFVFKDHLVR